MRIVTGGRLTGKTFKLIRLACDQPRSAIVVFSQAEKERVQYEIRRMDPPPYHEPIVLSMDEAPHRLKGMGCRVFVDNVDMILDQLYGRVEAVSCLGQETPLKEKS